MKHHAYHPFPLTLLALALAGAAQAAELPRIDILGKKAVKQQAGAVAVIDKEKLELLQPLSTQDALKTVAGVVIREEEGYGFIPNIGLRGLNPNRSQKVLVLEDGAPAAPSLFLANESYYSPRIERMEGIEVLKGAAGLRYGPTTIGGVINYKTKQVAPGVAFTAKAGTHGYGQLGLDAGTVSDKGDKIGGISLVTAKGDGFRHNPFEMRDVVLKGGLALGEDHWIGAKLSHYDNEVNTSYVGLRPNQYKNDPTQNGAPDDWFLTNREGVEFNHKFAISSAARLQTLVYWSELTRDYWRRDPAKRTADGTTFKPCDGTKKEIKDGKEVAKYCINGNNRTFNMTGVDSRLFGEFKTGSLRHEAEFGVRLHQEKLANIKIGNDHDPKARSGDIREDARSKAKSVALFAQDRMALSDVLALTMGMRVESYKQELSDLIKAKAGSAKNTEVVPGLGLTWQIAPSAQLFGGVFRGFSPAMVATAISADGVDQQLDAERSTNFELGLRGGDNGLRYEATLFNMDFANQIVNQSLAAGVSKANAGKTLHRGVELGLGVDLGAGFGIEGNTTWVPTARFETSNLGVVGNRIPYTPKLTSQLAINYQAGGFKASLSAQHMSSQFNDPANTEVESVDGTKGRIAAYTTLGLSAHYRISKQLSLFGTLRNLADRKYIASRNPDGIFPGAERNAEVGARYAF